MNSCSHNREARGHLIGSGRKKDHHPPPIHVWVSDAVGSHTHTNTHTAQAVQSAGSAVFIVGYWRSCDPSYSSGIRTHCSLQRPSSPSPPECCPLQRWPQPIVCLLLTLCILFSLTHLNQLPDWHFRPQRQPQISTVPPLTTSRPAWPSLASSPEHLTCTVLCSLWKGLELAVMVELSLCDFLEVSW